MSTYNPNKWVVVRIKFPDGATQDSVFGGWSGGYLDGDSWRLSSGIVSVEDKGDEFHIRNNSGSLYIVRKSAYGMTGYQASVLAALIEKHKETHTLEVLDELPEEYLLR